MNFSFLSCKLAFSGSFCRLAKKSLNCCCSFCWSYCWSCWHTNNAGSRVIKSSGPFLSGKEKTWQKLEQKCSFINFRSILLLVNIEQCACLRFFSLTIFWEFKTIFFINLHFHEKNLLFSVRRIVNNSWKSRENGDA